MPRQFRHGWSYKDDITQPDFAVNLFVDAPPVGSIKVVEVVRFKFTGANRTFVLYRRSASQSKRLVVLSNIAAGSFTIRGPFVLEPTWELGLLAALVTTVAEATADWIMR